MPEVQSEDEHAKFLKAYDEHADSVFRFCFFKVSHRELARDLTQEVFYRAWDYVASGKQVENFKALFYKIASNLVIDHYRKRKETSLDELMAAGFDPGSSSQSERMGDILDGAAALEQLQQLDQPYRDIMFMRYVEDMAVKDIARIFGEKENNISVKIYRALNQLRNNLKQ